MTPQSAEDLHQDLYGDLAFPIQVVILLSEPDLDFPGGEFALEEFQQTLKNLLQTLHRRKRRILPQSISPEPSPASRCLGSPISLKYLPDVFNLPLS